MAKRRKKTRRKTRKDDPYPGWVWMVFGLAIGLSVAAAVYFSDSPEPRVAMTAAEPVQSPQSPPAFDDNGETADIPPATEPRFDFYELLKKMEVEVDAAAPSVEKDTTAQAVVQEGTYILQAGSFSSKENAESRRAELGFQGIESRIIAANVNGERKYKVLIGPVSDLDRLNLLRSQLRAAGIDVLRMTVSD
ncbi:MAG: SPOR domain-containing protein [Woeseiaceae bacterium]|nr:SPOR domain-containing protein [Woeseiaceae bacterium]